jgi:hypothetical protein
MDIRAMGAELLHAEKKGQTHRLSDKPAGRHDEANSRCLQFYRRA